MKYDFIGISEQGIYGVKNPMLVLNMMIEREDYSLKILADNSIVDDYALTSLGDKYSFIVQANLPKKCKDIKIFAIVDGNEYLICELKNTLIRRCWHKITGGLKIILSKIKLFFHVLRKGIIFLWREHHFLVPPKMIKKYLHDFKVSMRRGCNHVYNPFNKIEYNKWIKENEKENIYIELAYKPLISIVIPVYNIARKYLSECLDSILNQKYTNFEICLADDCSTKEETIDTLKEYEKKDKRIKVVYRKKNGHISEASNSALKIAKGEFVAMMDDDDVIPPNSLYEMVKVLNEDKNIDFIYTDEDKLDVDGLRCDPNFKPDYSPDTLLSVNYLCHFTLLRTSILKEIGGWRVGYEGAQDYDLFLRFLEKTDRIYHIPKILYHWRKVEGSTSMTVDNKGYAVERGKKAVEDSLKRRKINAEVAVHPKVPYYIVNYKLKKNPKISILIPTRDYADILEECLSSLYERTTYDNFEVLVLNNNSQKEETFNLFNRYKNRYDNFRVIDVNTEFNYSYINNIGVKESKGEYIVLLNNDTKILTDNWLEVMVGYASQKHVGCVGVKLLYPDDTIQHGGVILGLGGVASHAFIGARRDDVGLFGRLSVPFDYSANTAACLMVKKSKYKQVGGLEESLKVAYNDVDLNLKLLDKGYYNVFLPQVELYHYESKSRGLDTTGEKYKRFLRESEYMWDKWGNLLNNDPFYNTNLSKKDGFKLDKKESKDK